MSSIVYTVLAITNYISEILPPNLTGVKDLSAADGKVLVFYLQNTFFPPDYEYDQYLH